MSGHTPWEKIKHKSGTPLNEFRVQMYKEEMLRQYNRPWWRLVRWWNGRKHGKA